MKASTGNSKMDILLDGGFDRGTNIAFLGRTFSGAYIFPIYFSARGTKIGDNAIILSVDKPYDRVMEGMKRFGAIMERCTILDLYSLPTGYVDIGARVDNTIFLENRYNWESILQKIEILMGYGGLYRIHIPVSSLLLYSSTTSVMNLVERVTSLVRKHESLGFYTINTGMHDSSVIEMFLRVFDSYFEFSKKEGTSYFRIVGMKDIKNPGWISFTEERGGISIESFALSKIR